MSQEWNGGGNVRGHYLEWNRCRDAITTEYTYMGGLSGMEHERVISGMEWDWNGIMRGSTIRNEIEQASGYFIAGLE